MNNAHDTETALPLQPKPTHHADGLRTPGLLGRYPLIGLVMLLLGTILFGALAINLQTHGPLLQTDTQVVNYLHVIALHSSPFVVDIAIFGSYTGEQVIVVIGGVLVVYFLVKRSWPELTMIIIGWGGEGAIWLVLANYFNRTRPPFTTEVWHLMTAPSFPSGHSFAAVLCYGLLAYMIVPKLSSHTWKIIVTAVAILLMIYVGISRVFVGDHYPTDILAGYALGIAWGGLVYTSVVIIAQRRRKHHETVHPRQEAAKI